MSQLKKLLAYISANKGELRRQGFEVHDDHPVPMTRRDLLSAGFYTGFYGMTLPTVGSLMLGAKTGNAQDMGCAVQSSLKGVPFAQFNFSGGRNLWGHGIALGLNRDGAPEDYKPVGRAPSEDDFSNFGLLADYHPMKGGSMADYRMLGGHPFQPTSYMYQSALNVFGAQLPVIDQFLTVLSFATKIPDDSGTVSQAMGASVAKFRGGSDFTLSANTAGTELNGINAMPAFAVAERATVVNNNDISQLLKTGLGSASGDLQKKYMETLYNLLQENVPDAVGKKIFGCSKEAAKKKLEQFSMTMDPFLMDKENLDRELVNHFATTDRTGVLSWMLAKGYASTVAVNSGGYDYHNSTSNGYLRDVAIFQNSIWPMINYFHAIQQPLIIFLTSDGSTRGAPGAVDTRAISVDGAQVDVGLGANLGDAERNAGAVMLIYSPQGRLPVTRGQQIGHGTPAGVAGNPSNPIGDAESNSYQQVVLETIRRVMLTILPSGSELGATFQEASGGIRFNEKLRNLIVV